MRFVLGVCALWAAFVTRTSSSRAFFTSERLHAISPSIPSIQASLQSFVDDEGRVYRAVILPEDETTNCRIGLVGALSQYSLNVLPVLGADRKFRATDRGLRVFHYTNRVDLAQYVELRVVLDMISRSDTRSAAAHLGTIVHSIFRVLDDAARQGVGFDENFHLTSHILIHGCDLSHVVLVATPSAVPIAEASLVPLIQLGALIESMTDSDGVHAVALKLLSLDALTLTAGFVESVPIQRHGRAEDSESLAVHMLNEALERQDTSQDRQDHSSELPFARALNAAWSWINRGPELALRPVALFEGLGIPVIVADEAEALHFDGALVFGETLPNGLLHVDLRTRRAVPESHFRTGRFRAVGSSDLAVVVIDFVIDAGETRAAFGEVAKHIARQSSVSLWHFEAVYAYIRPHRTHSSIVSVVFVPKAAAFITLAAMLSHRSREPAMHSAGMLSDLGYQNSAVQWEMPTEHPFSSADVYHLAKGLSLAIADLHDANVIHGYLCDSTLTVSETRLGVLQLASWAVASRTRFPTFGESFLDVRNAWAAPEIAGARVVGPAVTAASDVWSLGIVIAQIAGATLSLLRPNEVVSDGFIVQHASGHRLHVSPSPFKDARTLGLMELVSTCLRFAPEKRPTARQVYEALLRITENEPMSAASSTSTDSLLSDTGDFSSVVSSHSYDLTVSNMHIEDERVADDTNDNDSAKVERTEGPMDAPLWAFHSACDGQGVLEGVVQLPMERVYALEPNAKPIDGGNGRITFVRHRYTGAPLAVKTVITAHADTPSAPPADVTALAAYEWRTLRALSGPHVVPVLGAFYLILAARGVNNTRIVISYVMDRAISDACAFFSSASTVPARDALRPVVHAVASALAHMHLRGASHLDVKLLNVLAIRTSDATPEQSRQSPMGTTSSSTALVGWNIGSCEVLSPSESTDSLNGEYRAPASMHRFPVSLQRALSANSTRFTPKGSDGRLSPLSLSTAAPLSLPGVRFVLADFGGVRLHGRKASARLSLPRSVYGVLHSGTAYTTAPETLSRGVRSPASDVWALGVLVLEALDGVPFYLKAMTGIPGSGPNGSHTHDDLIAWLFTTIDRNGFPALTIARPADVPDVALAFASACLTKNMDDRPTIHELLHFPLLSPALPSELLEPRRLVRMWLDSRRMGLSTSSSRLSDLSTESAGGKSTPVRQAGSPVTTPQLSDPSAVLSALLYPVRYVSVWYPEVFSHGRTKRIERYRERHVVLRNVSVVSGHEEQLAREIMIASALAHAGPASLQRFVRAHAPPCDISHSSVTIVAVFEDLPPSLSALKAAGIVLSPEDRARILENVGEALEFLHRRRLHHGAISLATVHYDAERGGVLANPMLLGRSDDSQNDLPDFVNGFARDTEALAQVIEFYGHSKPETPSCIVS